MNGPHVNLAMLFPLLAREKCTLSLLQLQTTVLCNETWALSEYGRLYNWHATVELSLTV